MDPKDSECGGSDAKHCATLAGGQSTETWAHEAGRHADRQLQETLASPGFRGRIPITQAEALEKRGQEIFLEGQEYWEGYQVGDLDTKEQDKDYAARTAYSVGS